MKKNMFFYAATIFSVVCCTQVISKELSMAQEELVFYKLVELYENKQMTKENIAALQSNLQIDDVEKVLYKYKLMCMPRRVFLFFWGIAYFGGLGLSAWLADTAFDFYTNYWEKMLDRCKEWCKNMKTEDEIAEKMRNSAFCFLCGAAAVGITVSLHGLSKLYHGECERRHEYALIQAILREIELLDAA